MAIATSAAPPSPPHHPYAWCSACGTSLPDELKAALPPLQRQDPERVRQWRPGIPLVVESNEVACPICRYDRFRRKGRG
ncbi:MAG TPA: hypothetical protein VFJ16_20615 [Longimicrobium sp.]|nr:hypothetical protein [Longimicrobium sp.]